MEKLNFFEKRTFGQNFNFVLRFFKQNFIHFIVNILLINLPAILLSGLFIFSIKEYISPGLYTPSPWWVSLLSQTFVLLYTAYIISAVFNYYLLYEQKGPKGFQFKHLMQSTLNDLMKVAIFTFILGFFISVCSWILIFILAALSFTINSLIIQLGFLSIFIWFFVKSSFFWIILIRENFGMMGAMSKSFELVKNNFWNTLGLLFVFALICVLINLIIQFSFSLVLTGQISFIPMVLYSLKGLAIHETLLLIFLLLLVSFFNVMILSTAIFTQYGSIVDTREKIKLRSKIKQLGKTPNLSEKNENEQEEF